jgi:hypothetical protein
VVAADNPDRLHGQATGRAKPRKRKRYFEAETTMHPAAGFVGAAANAEPATCVASSSEEEEDANWESASDSEYGEEGLALGEFMEV